MDGLAFCLAEAQAEYVPFFSICSGKASMGDWKRLQGSERRGSRYMNMHLDGEFLHGFSFLVWVGHGGELDALRSRLASRCRSLIRLVLGFGLQSDSGVVTE